VSNDEAKAFESVTRLRAENVPDGRLTLLIMGASGVQSVPLPDRGELVVGRSAECQVRIEDDNLSRKHLRLRIGAGIEVEDLGSLNGSKLGDRRLEPNVPEPLREGDVVTIGDSVMLLQRAQSERPRHLWGHSYFEARLEDECMRAAHEPRSFSVLRVRLSRAELGAAAEAIFAAGVPAGDAVAGYAPGEYEMLLLDREPERARAMSSELRLQLSAAGIAATIGLASYPSDGRTPEALVAVAGARARGQELAGPPRPLAEGAIERMLPFIERVAGGTINVLLCGETGVGKEVLAETIHRLSPRAKMPLLRLNCAALSETLLESELFGYEKGAFTGAQASKQGLLETAHGGTVFLDELGEMPLTVQAKLLRVIEERKVLRIGALKPREIDVRFIAASNRDLEAEAARGQFRADLYFRLNGVTMTLPPLRERIDELERLTALFVAQASRQNHLADEPRISGAAMTLLRGYRWPGNIRELRNVVERAVLLCTSGVIMPEHLPIEKMSRTLPTPGETPRAPLVAPVAAPRSESDEPAAGAPPAPAGEGSSEERQRILDALQACAGNQTRAAQLLGISRRTLVTRLGSFNLPRPRKRD